MATEIVRASAASNIGGTGTLASSSNIFDGSDTTYGTLTKTSSALDAYTKYRFMWDARVKSPWTGAKIQIKLGSLTANSSYMRLAVFVTKTTAYTVAAWMDLTSAFTGPTTYELDLPLLPDPDMRYFEVEVELNTDLNTAESVRIYDIALVGTTGGTTSGKKAAAVSC